MKKVALLISFSLCAFFSFAQFPNNAEASNEKTLFHYKGALIGDKSIMLPVLDTLNNLATPYRGALTLRPQDTLIYYSDGVRWHPLVTGASGFLIDSVYVRAPDLGVDTTTIPGKQIIFYRRANGLTDGGLVTQSACRDLQITPAFYTINYRQYNSAFTTVTVDAASVFNRIDRIVADTNALVYILKGTSTGIAPQINPSFQVSIVEVPVLAGSSCLGVTGEIIYDSGTEWDTAHTGTMTVAFRNTDNPFTGTYAAFVSSYNDSSQIVFTKPSGTDTLTSNSVFRQALYFNNPFLNQMQWQLFNGTTAVTNKIVINPLFNFLDTAQYQVVAIPASAFMVVNPIFNKVVISLAGYDTSGAGGFYIDDVEFQKGIANIAPNSFVDSVVMRNINGVYTGTSADTAMYYSIKGVLTFISNIGSGGGGGGGQRFAYPSEDNIANENREFDANGFYFDLYNADWAEIFTDSAGLYVGADNSSGTNNTNDGTQIGEITVQDNKFGGLSITNFDVKGSLGASFHKKVTGAGAYDVRTTVPFVQGWLVASVNGVQPTDSTGNVIISIPAGASVVFNELFTGSTSTTLTLSQTYTTGTIRVYKNGVRLRGTDFTEAGATTITLNVARLALDEFYVDFNY